MTPATLAPPGAEPRAAAAPQADDAGVPALPLRAPLSRGPRRDPTGRLTRRGVAASLAVHGVLGLALILGLGERLHRTRPQPEVVKPGDEQVSYIDVGSWPSGVPEGGIPASADGAAPAPQVSAGAIDSAIARLPADQFPDGVPDRIPPAPRGRGNGGGVPGPATAPGGAGAGNASGSRTGAGSGGNGAGGGRMSPTYGDPRLAVHPTAVPEREKTEHERYMEHLGDRIATYNDSVADEAGRRRRARNWTVKDRNGREWGIGEGGVPVIAGRRIPVPLAPPIHVDRDQENAERERARQRDEINRQEADAERDKNFRDRARAIRERRDRERREREQKEHGTTTAPATGGSSTPTP